MVSRSEWVSVVSGLRFATEYGCLSREWHVPFDAGELYRNVRADVDKDTRKQYREWLLCLDGQEVEYGGVLWTGDVVDLVGFPSVVTGTMRVFSGELILSVVREHDSEEWRVTVGRLALHEPMEVGK